MIGNTNLTLQDYSDEGNNASSMISVDTDGISSTTNSSSATLNFSTENGAIASCSNIIYAGLYWTGRTKTSVDETAMRTVKFKGPGQSSYTTINASSSDIQYPGDNRMYSAYAEVTDIVKSCKTGNYWVADIATSTGSDRNGTGYYGGWGLIVVYENPKMKWRDVTIFDGYAYVQLS